MNVLQALWLRAQQEQQALGQGRLGLGPDPNADPGVNLPGGPLAAPILGPLHALGLLQEGAGNVAESAMGTLGGALVGGQQAGYYGLHPGETPSAQDQHYINAFRALQAGHPIAANQEMGQANGLLNAIGTAVVNPLNFAGAGESAPLMRAAARLGEGGPATALRAVSRGGHIVNELPVSPIRALLAAGRADQGERTAAAGAEVLRALLGREAPAADAGGAVARALGDAPVETSGGVPLAGLDLPLAPERRNYNAAAKLAGLPPGEFVKPEASPLAPQNFSVLRAARALARDEPAAVPAALPDLPATPEIGTPGPAWTHYGPETIHPGEGVTPELLDRFARLRQFPNPSELDVNAEIGAVRDPVTLLQQAYGKDWQNRLAALTGGKWGRPGSGATLVNGRVMLGDLDLTAALRDYLENRSGPQAGDFKGALKALLGVGPQGGTNDRVLGGPAAGRTDAGSPGGRPAGPVAAPGGGLALPDRATQGFTGTIDDVRNLILGESGRVGTQYPPLDPAFYAKRAKVDPAQVPAMLDQLAQEGTLGRLPDGSLAVKPAAGGALSNVDIPAEMPPVVETTAKAPKMSREELEAARLASVLQDLPANRPSPTPYGDRAKQLEESIRYGEMRLRDKRDSLGKKIPPEMLAAVQKSVDDSKAQLAQIRGGGDIAAGGDGGGFGLLPARLGSTLAGAAAGTGVGGLAGGGLGLATGHRGDQLKEDVAAGAGLGALAGGNVGSVAPEIGRAAPQVARQLAAASRGTMRSPTMYARGWRAGLAAQAEAAQAQGPRGLGGFVKALPAQWRSSVVMTFKQLPQDAISRWVTLWGLAKKELGVGDPDIARWQETIASQRDAGAPLDTPVERALRALGQDDLATPAGIHEVYGTDFLSAQAARNRTPLNRGQGAAAGAIFGAFNGLRQVNPLAVAAGAVKGRYQPFINGFVQFMNGVQHDAFRYAMAEKTLQRDIPPLARALVADLGARGVDVAPLVAKGDYFSGADVARVAGQAVGERWDTLLGETIRNGGDRVAFLAGDFRDKSMLPGEKALAAVFPFVRWPLHYGPVFAEIAANHPRLAAVAARTLANQRAQAQAAGSKGYEAATTPITTETPVLGALARARLGGQQGVLRAGLLGAVVPYANLAGGIDMPPDDANPYEKATAIGDAIGFSPNPLIQAGAYATGLDYRAPGALSRTAGLEGAVGLLPGPLGRLSIPAPGAALDALREKLTGQSSEYDPVMRRYAELVLDRTGQELAADANAPYLEFATPEARALYDRAKREVLTAGAVGNLASVASPVSLAARSAEGETIRQAKATVPYSADLIARMSPDLAATMQAVNARYLASVPATRAYRGASPSAREALLLGDIADRSPTNYLLDPLTRRQLVEAQRGAIRRTQPR